MMIYVHLYGTVKSFMMIYVYLCIFIWYSKIHEPGSWNSDGQKSGQIKFIGIHLPAFKGTGRQDLVNVNPWTINPWFLNRGVSQKMITKATKMLPPHMNKPWVDGPEIGLSSKRSQALTTD